MEKLYNKRFLFIVIFSFVFIMVLAFGSVALVKKNTTEFKDAGYIISSNKVLDFGTGTTYRLNLNEQIVFTTEEGEIHEVDQSSFIHYADGSIALLKNGAFVDLNKIGENIVPYYNITNKSVLNYRDGGYTILNGNNELYFDDILVRVNENKFLIAGKDISIKVPGVDELLSGQYFELTFIEDGIILIENDEDSYQVTADGTIVYVGENTIIDLGTKNALYNGEIRLNMTQVTIDGNENIDIVPEEEDAQSTGGGSGGGSGSGSGSGSGDGSGDGTGDGSGGGTGGGAGDDGSSGEGDGGNISQNDEVSIELVNILVDVKMVDATFQVNNPLKLTGELLVTITNTSNNQVVYEEEGLLQMNGALRVSTSNLASNATYMLSIKEIKEDGNEIEYLQRMFTTKDYGVSLKKIMVSDDEILYELVLANDSPVTEVYAKLYNNDGELVGDTTVNDENKHLHFTGLKSNSVYTIKLTDYQIGNTRYVAPDGYYLSRNVKTLKVKPTFDSLKIEANEEQSVFNLNIAGLNDPDSSITKYTFYVYEGEAYNEATSVPLITKETSGPNLTLEVGKDNIKQNANYRFRVLIEYHDNEKVGEIDTGISEKFKSEGVSVTFVQIQDENYDFGEPGMTHYTAIAGEITLQDPDCKVPIAGRACIDEMGLDYTGNHEFSVAYYVGTVRKFQPITFEATEDPNVFKVKNFKLGGLNPGTEYEMQITGDMYESGKFVSQAYIGNSFTGKTQDLENLKVEKLNDNLSTFDNPINVDLSLTATTTNNIFINTVDTMKVTLYALDNSNNKIQIGNVVTLNNEQIVSLLYNKEYQMTNAFFGINSFEELFAVASSGDWIYENYIIEFSEAYASEIHIDETRVTIENNEIKASISKLFLLEYYSSKRDESSAKVTQLKNNQLEKQVDKIDGTTIAAYKIDASIYIEDILRQYYGVTGADNIINWDYVYYIIGYKYEEKVIDGETIIERIPYTVYTSEKTKFTNHTFYLDDENIEGFDRGNEYSFGFQVVVSDGMYPSEIVIAQDDNAKTIFNPAKENPYIEMAIWESTANSITYMYKISKDVDNALFENALFIYDTKNNDLVDTQTISHSDEYQFVTFNNLVNSSTYQMKYKKANVALTSEGKYIKYSEASKGGIIFDGLHELTSDFTLKYTDSGNQLGIIISDAEIVNRGAAYSVTVRSDSLEKEFVLTKKDLVDCNESGSKNCILIDYQDLEEFQGTNTKVDVTAYYENGLIGLNMVSNYYVFVEDSIDMKYLSISDSGKVTTKNLYPNGLYTYTRDNMSINIKNNISKRAWNNELPGADFKLSITTGGVSYSNYGSYNPKTIKDIELTSSDNNFYFSSIIPMVKSDYTSKINTINLNLNLSGLTKTIVQNEYRSDDYKVYVDLYEDESYTNPITLSAELNLDDLAQTLSYEFTNLLPARTYYYKIYSYILNSSGEYVKTELYDYNETGVFEIVTKTASTLGVADIFAGVDSIYSATTTTDKYMTRKIEMTTSLLDLNNYKLVYTILDADGNNLFDDREVTEISDTIVLEYDISDDKFLFGSPEYPNGYILKITAVTLDDRENKLMLYTGDFMPHLKDNPETTELRDPTFAFTGASSYVPEGENKYAIDFSVAVNDPDLVIKNADYYVKVTDDYGNAFAPVGYTLDSEGFIKLNLMKEINTILTYKNLDPDAYYSITAKAETYKNNASLLEDTLNPDRRNGIAEGHSYIETGSEYNLDLGTGTLTVDNNILTVNYTGANNLQNITKVTVTVRKSNALVGTYDFISGDNLNFVNELDVWSLVMDLSHIPTTLLNEDQIRVVVRYYAKNLEGEEGQVAQLTYANYVAE